MVKLEIMIIAIPSLLLLSAVRLSLVSIVLLGFMGTIARAATFSEWQTANFSEVELGDDSISGLLATPRNDGLANLVRYGLGLNLDESPAQAIPEIVSVNPQMTVTFDRPIGLSDVTYQVQFTSDLSSLASWVSAALQVTPLDATRERVSAVDPLANSGGLRFSRVRFIHSSGVIAGPATNLTAIPTSPTEVQLNWEGDERSGGFLIEKSVDGGDFDIVGFVPSGTTTFIVKNLIPDEAVSFRASAVGTNVDATPSNEESVTPSLGAEGAVVVRFRNTQPQSSVVVAYVMEVENSTAEAIPLSELTIRYWVEIDNENTLKTPIYYATAGNGGIDSDLIPITPIPATSAQEGADTHIDFTFAPAAGTLSGGSPADPGVLSIQGAMHKDYGPNSFNVLNDFSFQPEDSFQINNRINILRNGELIFGIEPGGGTGGVDRPLGPSTLRAIPNSESSIELTWEDGASNETLFVIERNFAEEAGGFKILTTVDPNSTGFHDFGLFDEASYSYRVRAVNEDGVSSVSNVASTQTLEGTSPQFIPLTPEGLVVSPFSDGRLDLDWTDASRNEKGFVVERREISGEFVEIGRVASGTTSFIDYGLESGRAYTYRVIAYNLAGSSIAPAEMGTTDLPSDPGVPTDAEVVRFLRQASFGANAQLIAEVKAVGFEAWLESQFSLTPTLHLPASPEDGFDQDDRVEIWWDAILTAPDQARQRLAFALSQIFVVSQNDGDLSDQALALAKYYDMLVTAPESNFRELLEDVTFSPVMGMYLDHTRNQKADPATNIRPDENYAREIMQLFSIGLHQLNLDGTPKLDGDGVILPTYNQRDIEQVARVFTGLTFAGSTDFFTSEANFLDPMMVFPQFHETGSKNFDLLGSDISSIPAGQDPLDDFEDLHDGLANHSSVAPFICRQLIQRLVTSNPSPAYIERVSQVFENNGSGQRGDFAAVFKAILLDYEARSADPLDSTTYGKQREPIIRVATLLRALNASAGGGGFGIGDLTPMIQQSPLSAPSVFNFFEPDFALPGAIANLGISSPEFQTTQSSTVIESANLFNRIIFGSIGSTNLDFAPYTNVGDDVDALLDLVERDLMDGRLPDAMRLVMGDYLADIDDPAIRAKAALYLVASSAEFTIEQ